MELRIHKMFLVSMLGIFALGIIVVQFVQSKNIVFTEGSTNRGDVEASDAVGKKSQVKGETIEVHDNRINLLYDKTFLEIQNSKYDGRDIHLSEQKEVMVITKVLPPDDVEIIDSKNGDMVTLIWDPFKNNSPDSIQIYRSTYFDDHGKKVATVVGNVPGYIDRQVKIGKIYYYFLRSIKAGEQSVMVGPYSVGPIEDTVPPRPPQFGSLTVEGKKVRLSWTDPDDEDLKFINIYRSGNPGEVGVNIVQVTPGVETYLDEFVNIDETYYYVLASEDKTGNESRVYLMQNWIGNPNPFVPAF